MKAQYFTKKQLLDKFDKLPAKEQVSVLYESLELMQQFNGRSVTYCILSAMGYANMYGELSADTWYKHS